MAHSLSHFFVSKTLMLLQILNEQGLMPKPMPVQSAQADAAKTRTGATRAHVFDTLKMSPLSFPRSIFAAFLSPVRRPAFNFQSPSGARIVFAS